MNERIEAQFDQIAADALVRAERVRCDPEDFVEGMHRILDQVKERYEEACEEFGTDLPHS